MHLCIRIPDPYKLPSYECIRRQYEFRCFINNSVVDSKFFLSMNGCLKVAGFTMSVLILLIMIFSVCILSCAFFLTCLALSSYIFSVFGSPLYVTPCVTNRMNDKLLNFVSSSTSLMLWCWYFFD